MDDEYHQKLEENRRLAEEATAKKRAKRLKKKQGRKLKKRMKTKKENKVDNKHSETDTSDEDEETEKSGEVTEENDGCPKNVSTDKNKVEATEQELSLPVEENQDDTLKTQSEISSENVQCEDGT